MPKIINQQSVIDDNWQKIDRDFTGTLPEGDLLLPLEYWLANRESLDPRQGNLGIWIDSDEAVEEIGDSANLFPLIAINFPVFADGRGFSSARLLRDRYGYKGQLRAIGHVIRDQLFFLRRCGFDAFHLHDRYDPYEAISSLDDFSEQYQAAVDQTQPLFLRR